jgi:hypothetical protein
VKSQEWSFPISHASEVFVCLEGQPAAAHKAPEAGEVSRPEVNVIFTTPQATPAALSAALGLARHLEARVSVVVPQVVPRQFSFTSPPVSIPFTESRCHALAIACQEDVEIKVQVYLCGDKRQCLLQVLERGSPVVLGGRKRWWPSAEERLARFLESAGYEVIFVDQRGRRAALAGTNAAAHKCR